MYWAPDLELELRYFEIVLRTPKTDSYKQESLQSKLEWSGGLKDTISHMKSRAPGSAPFCAFLLFDSNRNQTTIAGPTDIITFSMMACGKQTTIAGPTDIVTVSMMARGKQTTIAGPTDIITFSMMARGKQTTIAGPTDIVAVSMMARWSRKPPHQTNFCIPLLVRIWKTKKLQTN